MIPVLILNGPNLNLLGRREPDIYGRETLQDIRLLCEREGESRGFSIDFRQSNHEGELVTWIQEAISGVQGLIINAAAYTHTSIAIHDSLKMLDIPVIEVHLSDPEARESFRHFSYVSLTADRVIKGKGARGYVDALDALKSLMNVAA